MSYLTGETSAPAAVFKGYAGVGKSTTLGVLVKSIQARIPGARIGVAAPTHKAVKVLKRDALSGVQYRTVHSWLKLKEQRNETTGIVFYAPDNSIKDEEPPIADINIFIVDEVSMLQDELFHFMVPWMKEGLKVVFTGDPAQIPPVKQQDCIPFLHGEQWGMVQVELTEIMRQKAGNPILNFATEIRSDYKEGSFEPAEAMNEKGEGIHLLSPDSEEENALLMKYFTSGEFQEDSDYMKVIAWRNVTVDRYNDRIRKFIYGNQTQKIMVGEKLIMDKPFSVPGLNGNKRVSLTTNEELKVNKLCIITRTVTYTDIHGVKTPHTFRSYNAAVEFYTPTGMVHTNIPIVHEDDEKAYYQLLEYVKKAALNAPPPLRGKVWQQYYRISEDFAWVKYNYAVTGHKSQGSSYDYCMVLKWDIDINSNVEERNRILYVACTRARNTLYIQP